MPKPKEEKKEAKKETEEKVPENPINMNTEFGNFDQMFKAFEEISK